MNRPPKKNKSKSDLLKDPRFETEELEAAGDAIKKPQKPVEGDDRNLVSVDEAFAEAEFEDKVWLIWNKYKVAIVGVSLIAILGGGSIQIINLIRQQSTDKMKAAYAAADSVEAKIAFAEEYSSDDLGGITLLDVADTKYEEEDFAGAATFYGKAQAALEGTQFSGRARVGEGIATIKSGNLDAGKSILAELATSDDALSVVKAQASYHLILLALEAKDFETAKTWMIKIEGLENGGSWARQAEGLKRSHPQLADSEEEDTADS